MLRASVLMAVLAFLLSASLLQAEKPGGPECTAYGRSNGRICTEIEESALRRPGDSTVWRIWLEGGGEPIDVRLHNGSPSVVRVKGGDDQIIHMGCRWHRQVRRKVTLIAPGEPRLEAGLRSPSTRQEAAGIAASLVSLLRRIEAEFLERRSRLPSDPPAGAVQELLDRTEADLLAVLSYQELAALRDYVREEMRQIRTSLPSLSSSGLFPRAVFASLAAPRPESFQQTTAGDTESALDRTLELIRRLLDMAQRDDLVIDLCIASEPGNGARFMMRPWSYNRLRETYTTGQITGLYRGLYGYRITRGLKRVACLGRDDCGPIDLVEDSKPVFQCNLEIGACKRLDDLPQGGCYDRP